MSAFAQVITFEESPDEVEAGIRHVEDQVIAPLRDADGLTGLWLVDRERGRRVSVMVWDSEEAASAGMAALQAFREQHGDGPRPTPVSGPTVRKNQAPKSETASTGNNRARNCAASKAMASSIHTNFCP